MTDAEVYSLVVTVALITGVVFLAISVLLFFRLKIIKVIGDLTGRSAKQGMKKNKEDVIKRREQELAVAKMKEEKAGKKQKHNRKTEKISDETAVLESSETTILESSETVVLQAAQFEGSDETTVLGGNETEVLMNTNIGETVPLNEVTEQLTGNESGTTQILDSENGQTESLSENEPVDSDMVIEDNITVVNTDVIIK